MSERLPPVLYEHTCRSDGHFGGWLRASADYLLMSSAAIIPYATVERSAPHAGWPQSEDLAVDELPAQMAEREQNIEEVVV